MIAGATNLKANLSENSSSPGFGAEKRRILVLLAAAQFLVVLDASITNVALPSIGTALDIPEAGLAWIVNSYVLFFGGFLLLGGRMADLMGRRRVFIIGLILFAIASLTAGLAQTEAMLVISRAAQGLGAAMLSPAALSIVTATFAEGKERNKALGVWGAVAGAGGAVGVLLGGILTEYLSWRWVFLVNVPVILLVLPFVLRYVPESHSGEEHNDFDVPGAVTVTAGLSMLVYALIDAESAGWTSFQTLGLAAGAVALLGLFLLIESRARHPLVPFDIFASRTRNGSYLVGLLLAASLFSMFFFVALYTQRVLGWDALEAGLSYLPLSATIILGAGAGSEIANRIGFKPVLVAGMLATAAGLLWFTQISVDGTFVNDVLGPSMVAGLGLGLAFPGATIGGTSLVREDEVGLASGLINSAQQIGGALGLAVLSSIAASKTDSVMESAQSAAALPGALTEGFQLAFMVGAGFALAGALLALLIIRSADSRAAISSDGSPPSQA
jgi:EmrB/QacA subfamily drug resistance transporter